MKQHSKLKRFFLICAAVCAAGIICTVIGVTAGGVEGFEKVAEKYDWVEGDPGERGVTAYPVEDFQSVEINGEADVYLLGKEFYKNATRLTSDDILEPTETDVLGKNKVIVIAGDRVQQPDIKVDKGVLKITSVVPEDSKFSINFSSLTWTPTILVCCPMQTLDSLKLTSDCGDMNLLGISWKNAQIMTNYGYIAMEGVSSGGLSMKMDSSDADLQGEFLKNTSIMTDSGDVKLETSLAKSEYGLRLHAEYGDIRILEPGDADIEDSEDGEEVEIDDSVDGEEVESNDVVQDGGPNTISMSMESGDMTLRFGGGGGSGLSL